MSALALTASEPRSPADLPLEHLEDQITELAAHIYAATCRWLLLVAEFDHRAGWAKSGCRSCAHWLSWRCGIDLGAAREQVRVARRLADLPLVREGFARGELSYSKVRAITRIAGEATEETLVDWARRSTAAQLEKLVRAHRNVAAADVDAAQAAHARRFLSWRWEDDGTLSVRGRLSPEDGAAFVAAIEAEVGAEARAAALEARATPTAFSAGEGVSAETSAAPPGFRLSGGAPDEDAASCAERAHEAGRGARSADALARLVEAARRQRADAGSPAGLTQVVVHVDAETLAADEIHDRCEIEDAPAVPPETARRMSCDSAVVMMRQRGGRVLDVGRRTRTVHPALRRALENRDGCCAFPGCGSRRGLHAHHILHWARGGPTNQDNLVLLCPFHHRLVHEGGYGVRRGNGEVRFTRPDGSHVEAVPPLIEGRADAVPTANADAGQAIDAGTCVPDWHGEPLHVDLAVASLCEREDRRRAT